MTGVRAKLAAAVRRVNAAYSRLPEPRPDPAGFDGLDAEIDAAFAAGDRTRALAAVQAWEEHWLAQFRKAGVA